MDIVFYGQTLGTWIVAQPLDDSGYKSKPRRLVFVPNKLLAGTLLYIESFCLESISGDLSVVIDVIMKKRFPDPEDPRGSSKPQNRVQQVLRRCFYERGASRTHVRWPSHSLT